MADSGKKVRECLRFALPSGLSGRSSAFSGGSGRTVPAFGQLQVAHQVVGQVHEADLHLGAGQPDGADDLATHAVLLETEDMLDAGAHLGALAVSRFLLGVERLPGLALLADVTLVAGLIEDRLGLFAAVGAVGPHPGIRVVGIDEIIEDAAVVHVRRRGIIGDGIIGDVPRYLEQSRSRDS